jgi:Glycosyl transferase family 2
MSKHPFISLAMIVKNEEACLGRALASAQGLYDELVIVDTGSTDRTVEIAREFGADVHHYDWRYPGHKGEARMMGIDAALGSWIVVLDADEIIKDPVGLRRWLHKPPRVDMTAANVLFENYIGFVGPDGRASEVLSLRWYQVRAFRRGLYRYRHREHELPHWQGSDSREPVEVVTDTIFEHRAPLGREGGKKEPMLDRLLLDVGEHPDDPGPRYFLHRQHLLNGEYQQCIDMGHQFLALCAANPLTIDPCECYGNLASAHHCLGDTQEAIRWLHKAAAEQAHRRIWWIRLAELHMTQGRWQIALAHLRLASELWPTFEWQWEPQTYGTQVHALMDKCQRALQASHHTH